MPTPGRRVAPAGGGGGLTIPAAFGAPPPPTTPGACAAFKRAPAGSGGRIVGAACELMTRKAYT